MTLDQGNQQRLLNILLTPISSNRTVRNIICVDGGIVSSQRYCYTLDPDMSDFAVGFYEALYGGTLLHGHKILQADDFVADVELAGDTMNSFNTVANMILGNIDAGHRSPESEWPEILRTFHQRYRTLANFWLLPMRFGRTGTKLNKYDSLDLFVSRLRLDFPKLREDEIITYRGFQSENYFRRFRDLDEFCNVHFIGKAADPEEVRPLYQNREGCLALVKGMIDSIEARAKRITESETVSAALWDYFRSLGLL